MIRHDIKKIICFFRVQFFTQHFWNVGIVGLYQVRQTLIFLFYFFYHRVGAGVGIRGREDEGTRLLPRRQDEGAANAGEDGAELGKGKRATFILISLLYIYLVNDRFQPGSRSYRFWCGNS